MIRTCAASTTFAGRIDSPFLLPKGGRCLTKSATTVVDPRRTMAQAVNAATRQDLLHAIRERYRGGLRDEKRQILDEFVAVTGYHRKHAIRLLMHAKPCAAGASRPARLPVYDAAVREALIVLWEASDRICGKRLKPLLPMLVSALERHGHLTLESTVRARMLAASAATLDRLLCPTRAVVTGKRVRGRATPAVQ